MRRPNGKINRENMITSAATESKNNLPYFGCVCVCVVVAAVCEPIRGRCFSGYNETIARGCVCASVPEVKFVDINRSRSEHNLCESMFSGRGWFEPDYSQCPHWYINSRFCLFFLVSMCDTRNARENKQSKCDANRSSLRSASFCVELEVRAKRYSRTSSRISQPNSDRSMRCQIENLIKEAQHPECGTFSQGERDMRFSIVWEMKLPETRCEMDRVQFSQSHSRRRWTRSTDREMCRASETRNTFECLFSNCYFLSHPLQLQSPFSRVLVQN